MTGKTYRVPINVFRRADQYLFALTYGPDVQWLKNVVAAGECHIRTRNQEVHLVGPELIHDPGLGILPGPVRVFLRLNRVTDVLLMRTQTG